MYWVSLQNVVTLLIRVLAMHYLLTVGIIEGGTGLTSGTYVGADE
jgi:hypothetical protein